jgi:medium-chain acyl-[acyl-carrier-protein] hydrolase
VFAEWQQELDCVQVCAVQLPGRQNRLAEAPFTRIEPLADALAAVIAPYRDIPFACYGHSVGGFVVFELARRLRKAGGPQPAALFIGSCRAPHVPPLWPPIAELPDATFIAALQRYDGMPPALRDHRELIDLALPALRSDVGMYEKYVYTYEEPLACPIFAYGGRGGGAAEMAALTPWARQTRGAFRTQMISGSHLFIEESRHELLQAVARDVATLPLS